MRRWVSAVACLVEGLIPHPQNVTSELGARTAWQTHALGQTLIVTAGCGRVQHWGGTIQEVRAGDVVWFEPGEKHWHGASPTTAMAHIAITDRSEGQDIKWRDKVSDEEYLAGEGAQWCD